MATYKFVNADKLDADLQTVADKIREKSQTSNSLAWPSGFIEGIDQCSSLNFAVVGGASKPENPVENTIWVNTETEITSWSISPEQPESPTSGMVWINNGASSESAFNALKKNEIKVYPQTAKQYVGGKWADVESNIYQGGTWIKPETGLVIYDSGAFGRDSNGIAFDANCVDDGEKVISIAKNAAYMQWTCGEKTWGLFYIAPMVSCNGYKTLNISLTNVSASVDNEGVRWGLAKTIDAESPQFAAYKQYDTFSNNMTLTLDVSGVGSTACYIALRVSNDVGDSFSARVTKIWLE